VKELSWLVDTSVWISFIRGDEKPAVLTLRNLLEQRQSVFLTSLVYLEILQGSADLQQFARFKSYFGSQPFVELNNLQKSMVEAAAIYFRCRKRGVTVRSTIDTILVQIALENQLILLHNDRDFEQIATIVPEFQQTRGDNHSVFPFLS